MKFSRYPRHTPRGINNRRLAAARRALQRQADEVALFPELQPTETPEERIARLDDNAARWLQGMRDHLAKTWRWARHALRTMPADQRAAVLRRWNHPTWHPPHDAAYLADLVFTVANNPETKDNP